MSSPAELRRRAASPRRAPGRFWHGYANMAEVAHREIVFVRGSGCRLEDRDGNSYIDATAGLWYCNIGYGRTTVAQAMGDQAAQLHACSGFEWYTSAPTLELTEQLAELVPIDDPVFFLGSGGSDAIETAAKLARRYWYEADLPDKTCVISREGSYHGAAGFGTGLAGIARNREGFGEVLPDHRLVPMHDAQALAASIDAIGAERVAAFFVEPVIGSGVHAPSPNYLRDVAAICRERDVLLVVDEVVTGFGRLGAYFACDLFEIRPDMIVFAKGVTSGYAPLGGVAIARRVAEPFWSDGSSATFRHGYTYSGHAVACVSAMANLEVLREESLCDRVTSMQADLKSIFSPLAALDEVSEVRCAGLIAGVQVDPALLAEDPDWARRAVIWCQELGVVTRMLTGMAFHVSPSLTVTSEELEQIAQVVAEASALASSGALPGSAGRT